MDTATVKLLGAISIGMVAALWAASCAMKPTSECQPYEYRIAEDADGAVYRLLDEEDVAKLHALITGLAHGTCRLPSTQAPRQSEQPPTPVTKGLDA